MNQLEKYNGPVIPGPLLVAVEGLRGGLAPGVIFQAVDVSQPHSPTLSRVSRSIRWVGGEGSEVLAKSLRPGQPRATG